MIKRVDSSESGAVPRAQRSPVPAMRAAGAPGKTPGDAAVLGAMGWSFNGVLQRVLGFSRAAEIEVGARRSSAREQRAPAKTSDAGAVATPSPAFNALKLFVRSLDGETQDKLRTLMRAGREALTLPAAVAALSLERTGAGASVSELFARGTAELQDLQRGHAVACATGFDLELTVAVWGTIREPRSLDERVWLRFGRELAQSCMEEWACFAVVDSCDRLQKLYLRRSGSRWWSFAALIDRPSGRALRRPGATRSGRARLVVLPMQAALGRPCRDDLAAVSRASMAVSARLGKSRPTARRAAAPAAAEATP